ncbi:MarR family winged helix-turn-helix transcriptional regulator [Lactococcus formosensis]|jgi:DNA-binding MarR family transcriptional regulator|uniref:MarR family transcriptional regulator n=1 Tax=Lactococcus formosensis TaxID=1281486 RepID=A0A9Q9D6A0_9LACT|nr:MarR family transcriptional regulator [Lactococcus formosensis]USJ19975.1 MarR family transcriptional regulator [Lactococcus formosensis]
MKYREIMTQFSTALGKLDMAYALVAHEYNLTFNGLMTLYIIDESDTVTQKEISEILFLPKSTVHSLLLKLQKQDILELIKGKNEKEKFIVFTPNGRKIFEEIQEQTDIFETQVIEEFGLKNTEEFLENTKNFTESLLEKAQSIMGDKKDEN